MEKKSTSYAQLLREFLDPARVIDPERVARLLREDPAAAVFLILELRRRALPQPAPHTPSGAIPPQNKPNAQRRKKKPGRKKGHPGARRPRPNRIDRQEEHHLDCCPHCGGAVHPCQGKHAIRTRIIEDLPENIRTEIVEHIIHRAYCPGCKKTVEPPVPDALPGATLGLRLLSLTAYWHYQVGIPVRRIVEMLNAHLHCPLSAGGLVRMWQRLAKHLGPWYAQLVDEARQAAVLHADETGWRINGQTHWLWCFSSADTTVYMIDRNRGSPALKKFFEDAFAGTLVTDFWAAYNTVTCERRQFCLAHLLRELERTSEVNPSPAWQAFARKAMRLFRDALRLRKREDFTPETYASRIQRLNERLVDLMLIESTDPDVRRIAKRLRNYWDELLTFLDHPEVPPTNNHVERELRPAVIWRKVMQGNRSDRGAGTQAGLMSILRTLQRRGYKAIDTLVEYLQISLRDGKLPPFPTKPPADG